MSKLFRFLRRRTERPSTGPLADLDPVDEEGPDRGAVEELKGYLAGPAEEAQTWFEGEVMMIGDRAHQTQLRSLAQRPLVKPYEDVARALLELLRGLPDGKITASSEVRAIGEQLCASGGSLRSSGGRWLMVLVAERVAYLADPEWRAKRDERIRMLRAQAEAEGRRIGGMSSGPFVRELEYAWDGICGWQH